MPATITASQETWVITGNKGYQTYSSTAMTINSDYSAYRLPEGAVEILTQLLLDYARHRIVDHWKNVGDSPGENIQSLAKIKPKFQASFNSAEGLAWEMWIRILSFAVGINAKTPWESVKQIGAQRLYWRNPNLLRSPASLFSPVPMTTIPRGHLIEAVLRGDFRMVAYYAHNNPERFLEKGSGIGFLRGQFSGSALQAALSCGDFAPNENSQGMVEMMVEQLEQLHPTDWHNKFTTQALQLYKSSLRFYVEYQDEKINALQMAKAEGLTIDENTLSDAISKRVDYSNALITNNFDLIFNMHAMAQSAYTFDFNATIDAITNASDLDRESVFQNPHHDNAADSASCKALRRTLAQCREAFTAFASREKCANPNHLLSLHARYDLIYNSSDRQCLIRTLFCQHLITTAQQTTLPAIDVQILKFGLEATVSKREEVLRSFTATFPAVFDPADRYVLLGQRPRCGAGSPHMLAKGNHEFLNTLWEERANKCRELCMRAAVATHNRGSNCITAPKPS